MSRNRGADTKPEIAVRSALHAAGLRFRKSLRVIAGEVKVRPDVVFTRARIAVFIDGCYWHCCPDHGTQPRRNEDYWSAKLAGNVARDRRVDEALRSDGWTVIRAWEHEPPQLAVRRVLDVLSVLSAQPDSRRPTGSPKQARSSTNAASPEKCTVT
jgi:DNA mismatch endonuclease (patch repair protein)